MAEMIIMLRRDPRCGKQSIIIKLHSDPDALPHEHEQLHRQLVEKALGRKLEDAEEIIIEREPAAEPAATLKNDSPQEKLKQGHAHSFRIADCELRIWQALSQSAIRNPQSAIR